MNIFPFTQEQIDSRKHDWVCIDCGINFLTEQQLQEYGHMRTFHQGKCCLCKKTKSVTNCRAYNYLQIPKQFIA